MTPRTGTAIIKYNAKDPSRSPFEQMAAAVRRSPNAKLHLELTAFVADAHTGVGYTAEASSIVGTCKQIGFGS